MVACSDPQMKRAREGEGEGEAISEEVGRRWRRRGSKPQESDTGMLIAIFLSLHLTSVQKVFPNQKRNGWKMRLFPPCLGSRKRRERERDLTFGIRRRERGKGGECRLLPPPLLKATTIPRPLFVRLPASPRHDRAQKKRNTEIFTSCMHPP